MAPIEGDQLRGHLASLVLAALEQGTAHGWEIWTRLEAAGQGALRLKEGSLYPALYRLEHRSLITAEWGQSENNRRAKYYTLTAAGRRCLREETAGWNRLVSAIAAALSATPGEV